MIQIRPVSDLRDKFSEIEKIINRGEPVYLTKNGYGTIVVLSVNEFERITQNTDLKLLEAGQLAEITDVRLSAETVFDNARKLINEN